MFMDLVRVGDWGLRGWRYIAVVRAPAHACTMPDPGPQLNPVPSPEPPARVAPKLALRLSMTTIQDSSSEDSARDLNLTTHRAPGSVWDRRGWDGTRRHAALVAVAAGRRRRRAGDPGASAPRVHGIGARRPRWQPGVVGHHRQSRPSPTSSAGSVKRVNFSAAKTIRCTKPRPTHFRPAMRLPGPRRSAPDCVGTPAFADAARAADSDRLGRAHQADVQGGDGRQLPRASRRSWPTTSSWRCFRLCCSWWR